MSQAIISAVEKSQMKSDVPEVSVGDTVDVHCRILEGDKEGRRQLYRKLGLPPDPSIK